jgi:preprotein translocase subunit YajC
MWRLIVILLVLLAIAYYFMLLLQTLGVIQFTDKKLKPGRMFIPFYYWFANSQEKPNKEKSKLVKPIKTNDENGTDSSKS